MNINMPQELVPTNEGYHVSLNFDHLLACDHDHDQSPRPHPLTEMSQN